MIKLQSSLASHYEEQTLYLIKEVNRQLKDKEAAGLFDDEPLVNQFDDDRDLKAFVRKYTTNNRFDVKAMMQDYHDGFDKYIRAYLDEFIHYYINLEEIGENAVIKLQSNYTPQETPGGLPAVLKEVVGELSKWADGQGFEDVAVTEARDYLEIKDRDFEFYLDLDDNGIFADFIADGKLDDRVTLDKSFRDKVAHFIMMVRSRLCWYAPVKSTASVRSSASMRDVKKWIKALSDDGVSLQEVKDELDYRDNSNSKLDNNLFEYTTEELEAIEEAWYGRTAHDVINSSVSINSTVEWDDFNQWSDYENIYLPREGEGDTKATQLITAVTKLVYKWFNDGDVFDNSTGNLEGFANDLSSYANWIHKHYPEFRDTLDKVFDAKIDDDYTNMLYELCEIVHHDEFLARENDKPKVGSIYDCEGPYEFDDRPTCENCGEKHNNYSGDYCEDCEEELFCPNCGEFNDDCTCNDEEYDDD